MALFHKASITPTKPDFIAEWVPKQSWCPRDVAAEVVGAFRFDDPQGEVGIETHLVRAGDAMLQVPLTYRNEPLDGAEAFSWGTIEHSALGTRHVYDAVGDDRYVRGLLGAAMTGQGEALGMAVYDGRWHIAPANVRIEGGGWDMRRVPVDQMQLESTADDGTTVLANDHLQVTFFRHARIAERPPMGLAATLATTGETFLLAVVEERTE